MLVNWLKTLVLDVPKNVNTGGLHLPHPFSHPKSWRAAESCRLGAASVNHGTSAGVRSPAAP